MRDTEDHLAEIESQGFTVLHDVFDADRAAALVARLDELESSLGITPADNSFEGSATVRIYNLLAHGALFASVPVEPRVLAVVEGVLDRGCLISSLSSIAIGPDETAQPIHADDQVMPLPRPHVATVCNSMWALTDFTEANGATRVVPGSHHWAEAPEYGTHYDSIPAVMPRGSVLVWHGSLWHGGGANTTGQRRVGLAMNYCAGWVRQQENQQLGIPLDVVRTFEPRLRELCGFGTYRQLIGHIDKQTPAQRLLDDQGSPSLFDVT
jgi:ectoine hydroxylase-related dioxygenase (phytanoyl-CoA dioxygenase family)